MQTKTGLVSLANRGIKLENDDWLYISISTIVVKIYVVSEK